MNNPSNHRPANRLASSSSPYLLQHARNPVDWYPWGDEAFAHARQRNVPIFLSIGYSTCYWCHVMERESFENPEIAATLNTHFVCVKIDREERPDLDDVYMQATLSVRGHGGWPMTLFLEPDNLRPFWCGTYLPPEPRANIPGLPQVALGVAQAWEQQHSDVIEQAAQIAAGVADHLSSLPQAAHLGVSHVSNALGLLLKMHDRQHGGFGAAPKFPQPVFLDLLLDARPLAGSDETSDAIDLTLRHTLDRMALGGLFDQVGGGFHRYSVDAHWTVPHFEKMLYDQALLVSVYTKAARQFDDAFYKRTATRSLDFVLRELQLDSGAFASALDAEVSGREGLNYLWTPQQARDALGADDHTILSIYGLLRGPNFRDPHHPSEPASNVLRLGDRPERLALDLSTMPETLWARIDAANERLLAYRDRRTQPHRDDKALTSWNGLMIHALAHASAAFDEPRYAAAAARAANAVLTHSNTPEGLLARSSRLGVISGPGFLEDYACLALGLLALARLGGPHAACLGHALSLLDQAANLFSARGRWFDTRDQQHDLFVRGLSTHDGAMPSGVSVLLHALLDAHELSGHARYAEQAGTLLASISGAIDASSIGASNSMRGLLRALTTESLRNSLQLDASRPAPTPPKRPRGEDAVEVYAGVERVRVTPDEPAELLLLLRIKDGYHVIAAEPGPAWDASLRPFRVGIHNGTGIAAYADYPTGKPIAVPGGAPVLAYEGSVEIRVALETDGSPRTGKPLLIASFQACSDSACLAPTMIELDVAIDS